MILPRVEPYRDRVVVTFDTRTRDLILDPDEAVELADRIEAAAGFAAAWVQSGGPAVVLRGETRGARVQSWDGKVNVRLDEWTNEESIPFAAARRLAAEIRAKAPEAAERMTITWGQL